MRVNDFVNSTSVEVLCEGNMNSEIDGCYCSDLLSHCMSGISAGNIWVTVQVNINIVAIAVLTELSAIVIAQGMHVDETVIEKAKEEGITILRSPLNSYELCVEIGKII